MPKERDLARLLRDRSRFPIGSVVFIEPRYGIEPGQPDTMILLGNQFTPLELKVRSPIVKALRPAQYRWTIYAIRAGATCLAACFSGDQIKVFQFGTVVERRKNTMLEEVRVETVDVEGFNLKFLLDCQFIRDLKL